MKLGHPIEEIGIFFGDDTGRIMRRLVETAEALEMGA